MSSAACLYQFSSHFVFNLKVTFLGIKMNALLIVVFTVVVANSKAVCPNKGFMESLDLNKFMGTWYQYASLGKFFVKGINRCVMSTFQLGKDGKTIKMANNFILKGLNNHVTSNWTATASDASSPTGKLGLKLKLPGSYGNMPLLGKLTLPLMVLDTDYDNYAIIYACKNILGKQFDFGFILTRERVPGEEVVQTVLERAGAALTKVGTDHSRLTVSNQENCDKGTFTVDLADVANVFGKISRGAMTMKKLAPLIALAG